VDAAYLIFAALAGQPSLFGDVAAVSTARRVLTSAA
jgi:hypothetical protein